MNNAYICPIWDGKVFLLYNGSHSIKVSNFKPTVKSILNTGEDEIIVFDFDTEFGIINDISIPFKKLRRTSWFDICHQCTLYGNENEAKKLMYEYVKTQIIECAGKSVRVGLVQKVGWHRLDDGTYRYECGNCCIGQSDEVMDRSAVGSYRLDYSQDIIKRKAIAKSYLNLLQKAPDAAVILLDYFFTGLIRSVYRQAEIPVDFVIYLTGVQQSRKTTLAKLTNNLYCRKDNMDFAVRSLPEMSKADIDHVVAQFSDSTIILDDVATITNKGMMQKREELLEYVVRLIGNHAKQIKCFGNGAKEFDPNVNIVLTGEYIPHMAESALTRMIIIELAEPVSREWLNSFQMSPELLSTVAYDFLQWVQSHFEDCVETTKHNLQKYREQRLKNEDYQERIQEHAFILENTNFLVSDFLKYKTGDPLEIKRVGDRECRILKKILIRQVELIEKYKIRMEEKNFCDKFVSLYLNGMLQIEKDGEDYDDRRDDGFMKDQRYICIKSEKLLAIMKHEYGDASITTQKITKQFRLNRFLVTESGIKEKSTKKIDGRRYLCIDKKVIKDYARYNMGLRD